jgi:hypothetical protein
MPSYGPPQASPKAPPSKQPSTRVFTVAHDGIGCETIPLSQRSSTLYQPRHRTDWDLPRSNANALIWTKPLHMERLRRSGVSAERHQLISVAVPRSSDHGPPVRSLAAHSRQKRPIEKLIISIRPPALQRRKNVRICAAPNEIQPHHFCGCCHHRVGRFIGCHLALHPRVSLRIA